MVWGSRFAQPLPICFIIQTYVFSNWTWDVPCEVEPFKPTRLQAATVASIDPAVTTSSSTSPPVSPSAASWRTSSSEDVTSPVVFEDFESEIDEEYWRKYQSLSASHNVFFATKWLFNFEFSRQNIQLKQILK